MEAYLITKFIKENWKPMLAIAALLFMFLLYFIIERQQDRIDRQGAELESLKMEIAELHSALDKNQHEVEAVKKYFEKINAINNSQKKEEEHNAECSVNTDNISVINHINELFGFCEQQTE